ncbi:hypothetical protein AAHE18_13G102500 [Arachis hypogaea]
MPKKCLIIPICQIHDASLSAALNLALAVAKSQSHQPPTPEAFFPVPSEHQPSRQQRSLPSNAQRRQRAPTHRPRNVLPSSAEPPTSVSTEPPSSSVMEAKRLCLMEIASDCWITGSVSFSPCINPRPHVSLVQFIL